MEQVQATASVDARDVSLGVYEGRKTLEDVSRSRGQHGRRVERRTQDASCMGLDTLTCLVWPRSVQITRR